MALAEPHPERVGAHWEKASFFQSHLFIEASEFFVLEELGENEEEDVLYRAVISNHEYPSEFLGVF